ncbi:MAG: dihydropyrimidinase [Candidatus Hermodarchaeota archaeon]
MDLLIKDGLIVTESGMFHADIGIEDGKIVGLFKSSKIKTADNYLNAKGLLVFPGIIDSHVHFQLQDLGRHISTDTFESGTKAAAFGGVTTIIDFADQIRDESPIKAFEERKTVVDPQVVIDYGLHVSLTDVAHVDEIPLLISEGVSSFKLFTTYSWRNLYLNDAEIFEVLQTLQQHNALAVVHCENDALAISLRDKMIQEGRTSPIEHARSRPNFVEAEAIQRILLLAKATSARVHIFHISTEEGSRFLAETKRILPNVTGETCPHYLLLDESAYTGVNGYLNLMSPPLRTYKDRRALLHRIFDETFDLIVTDHCEFSRESKGLGKLPFHEVLNGVPGIETSLPLMHDHLVNQHGLTYPHLIRLLSTNPAKIFGLYPKKGNLSIGADADIVIFDPKREVTITADQLHYDIDWTPYEGQRVTGWPISTISKGQVIVADDEFHGKAGDGRYLKRHVTKKS